MSENREVIRYKNLYVVPVYHSRLNFSEEVRKVFFKVKPDVIAIELPKIVQEKTFQAVNRFPKLSVLFYYDDLLETHVYIPIDPADSMIEGIQLGLEYGIPVEFVDLFTKEVVPRDLPLPDEEALKHLDLPTFYNLINERYLRKIPDDPKTKSKDELREEFIAASLATLMDQHERILVVIGMQHWYNIKKRLETNEYQQDLDSFEADTNIELYNILSESTTHLMREIPNIVYQYTLYRQKCKNQIDIRGPFATQELPEPFDRAEALKKIILRAKAEYLDEYNENISPFKINTLFQYLRNLTLLRGYLFPSFFDTILAAKSIINDDFAWLVHDECIDYPAAQKDDNIETIEISPDRAFLGDESFTIKRLKPTEKELVKLKFPLGERPQEKYQGEWRDAFFDEYRGIVSYPIEDIFEENFFQYVRKRALRNYEQMNSRVHEFKSTLMDGINIKATLRNWAYKKKIYVNEEVPVKGDVDGLVIIFDPNEYDKPKRYRFKSMFYAEHEEESDLAFYSTPPGEHLVGPGISRVELGGVVSFFPPRNVPSFFDGKLQKTFAKHIKSDADLLLFGALMFSEKKYVTYVAHKKPRDIFQTVASRQKIKILYIPITRFNPVTIRAVRNIHILSNRKFRRDAHKYIKRRRY